MTRYHAAMRLLEHGPLTFREFREITGWTREVARLALVALIDAGVATVTVPIERQRGFFNGTPIYSLAEGARA